MYSLNDNDDDLFTNFNLKVAKKNGSIDPIIAGLTPTDNIKSL